MTTENKGFFGGLKKMFFKDDEIGEALPAQNNPPVIPSTTTINSNAPVQPRVNPQSIDDNLQRRAFQLIESINQPGVDFFEVWNAAVENGGVNAANVKAAFTALRFADGSLNKEKVVTSGNYYCNELSKALQNDLDKKTLEITQLKQQKDSTRDTLSKSISDIDQQLKNLQESLLQKKKELTEIDATYNPRIKEVETKMTNGQMAIQDIVAQMQQVIALAQKEL